jgi:hypothetical protein
MLPGRSSLWQFLFRQGVVYFLVAFIANFIFLFLNLNGAYFSFPLNPMDGFNYEYRPTHYLLICRFHECHVQLAPRRVPRLLLSAAHSPPLPISDKSSLPFTLPPVMPTPGQLDVVCGHGSDNHIDSDGAFVGEKKVLILWELHFLSMVTLKASTRWAKPTVGMKLNPPSFLCRLVPIGFCVHT